MNGWSDCKQFLAESVCCLRFLFRVLAACVRLNISRVTVSGRLSEARQSMEPPWTD